MKRLRYFDGDQYKVIYEDDVKGTYIYFDEEKQIAKVSYLDGDTVIIKSPYMVIEESYRDEQAGITFKALCDLNF